MSVLAGVESCRLSIIVLDSPEFIRACPREEYEIAFSIFEESFGGSPDAELYALFTDLNIAIEQSTLSPGSARTSLMMWFHRIDNSPELRGQSIPLYFFVLWAAAKFGF